MYESRRKLPCPCGKKRVDTWLRVSDFTSYYYVKCPKCGFQTKTCRSEISAIRVWNKMVTATLAETITEYKEDN